MEEKANIVDDSAINIAIGSSNDIKQSFGRRHFAELIPAQASAFSVKEKSNDVLVFKATAMPKFEAAHAKWERVNDLRQQRVQVTLPLTPELMKRLKNTVNANTIIAFLK